MVCSRPLKETVVTIETDEPGILTERKCPKASSDKKTNKDDAAFFSLCILNTLIFLLPTTYLSEPEVETFINIWKKTLIWRMVFDTGIESTGSKNRSLMRETTKFIDTIPSASSEIAIVSTQTLLNRINNIQRIIVIFYLKLLQNENEYINKYILEYMYICSQCDKTHLEQDKSRPIYTNRTGDNTLLYREVRAQDDPTDCLISLDVRGHDRRDVDQDKVPITKKEELAMQGMLENKPENELVKKHRRKNEKTSSRIGNDEEQADLVAPQNDREGYTAKGVEQTKQPNMVPMETKFKASEKQEEGACRKQTVAKTACENSLANVAIGKLTNLSEGDGGSPASTKTTQQKSSEEQELENGNGYVVGEEDDQQKPSSSFTMEPDEVEFVKTYIKEMAEHSEIRPVEQKENCNRKMENDGLRKISDADIAKQILSMIHIKNIQDTLTVYMLPTNQRAPPAVIGDIPWAWLKDEKWRLSTFANYPITASKPGKILAANGFVYIGSGKVGDHITMCFFCHMTKVDWRRNDSVSDIHFRQSPNCPMITVVSGVSASGSQASDPTPSAPKAEPPTTSGASLTTPTYSDSITTSASERLSGNDDQMRATSTGNSNSRDNAETARILTSGALAPMEIGNQPISSAGSSITSSISSQQEPRTNPSTSFDVNGTQNNPTFPTTFSASSTGQTATPLPRNTNSATPQSMTRVDRLSYDDLGIVTERPKRPEYAARQTRFETFSEWPADHPLTKEDLADAGFYYAGYSDCGRCFYCGGGVRNWEDDDEAWLEHARWFPKCGFVKQTFGMGFITAVRELDRDHDRISLEMVAKKMGVPFSQFQLQDGTIEYALKEDPAVKTVVGMGYREDDVIEAAQILKDSDVSLSADILFDKLQEDDRPRNLLSSRLTLQRNYEEDDASSPSESIRNLKERNNELRQQLTCKICMDKDVSIIFLPCGHLVSCRQCAAAMKNCPLCRVLVKGTVKASLK